MHAFSPDENQPDQPCFNFRRWVKSLYFDLFRDARHFDDDDFCYCGIFKVTCAKLRVCKLGRHLQPYNMYSFFENLKKSLWHPLILRKPVSSITLAYSTAPSPFL